jgi:hypothetical protein
MGDTKDSGLPLAEGPLILLSLHDGQTLYAVVKSRRREHDGSCWYDVQLHLPSQVIHPGRLECQPSPVDLRVPQGLCTAVPGQDYTAVPTARYGATPDWRIEGPCTTGRSPVRRASSTGAIALPARAAPPSPSWTRPAPRFTGRTPHRARSATPTAYCSAPAN